MTLQDLGLIPGLSRPGKCDLNCRIFHDLFTVWFKVVYHTKLYQNITCPAQPMVQGGNWDVNRVARSVPRKKPDTLDLFPSSVREPKIEGLDLYTYVYISVICVWVELKFSTGQVAPKPDSPVQNRKPGNPRCEPYESMKAKRQVFCNSLLTVLL